MATESKRKRNYATEYLIRIARGLAGGKSNASPQPFKRSEPLEDALKLMKKGVSQKEAAKQSGVSAETLRRFQKANTTSEREGRRWAIWIPAPCRWSWRHGARCAPSRCRTMRAVTSAATGLR
jgi:hypothetical protein